MAANSWREIPSKVGLEVAECVKRWKNTRDKYVRLRKKLAPRSGDPGGKKVPAFYIFLSWLAPHIKHRVTESNFDEGCSDASSTNSSSSSSSSMVTSGEVALHPEPSPSPPEPSPSPLEPSPLPLEPSPLSPRPSPSPLRPSPSPLQPRASPLQPSPLSPQPSSLFPSPRNGQKRNRKDKDDWMQVQVARLESQLEERRTELQQRLSQNSDESSRFGNTVADMLRRVPEEHRSQAMFDVYKLLFECQQKT
ncbi:probable serine/threonine-protein kinase samkC [Triplophysa rosa]|nr:probable serine/threonine-protein kinase samkC [Triplophysa rosa]